MGKLTIWRSYSSMMLKLNFDCVLLQCDAMNVYGNQIVSKSTLLVCMFREIFIEDMIMWTIRAELALPHPSATLYASLSFLDSKVFHTTYAIGWFLPQAGYIVTWHYMNLKCIHVFMHFMYNIYHIKCFF